MSGLPAVHLAWILPLLCTAQTLQAKELEIHGSMAQGYVISDGNNAFGSSTNGSTELNEVALNFRTSVTPAVLISAQAMARKSGGSDDGRMRLDFAQLDYQFYTGLRGDAGLRLGRLKNPYGLYNDSRDVVFSRPGITLPASVYFEGVGLRDLFFSSDAGQLYGHWISGDYASDVIVGLSRTFDATDDFKRSLSSGPLDGAIKIRNFTVAQWLNEWDSGRYRAGLSYLGANVFFEPDDPALSFARFKIAADIGVVSLQYQSELSALTFEYMVYATKIDSARGDSRSKGDGAYLQYRYLLAEDWAALTRYDLTYSNRNDRDGRDYAAGNPNRQRHSRFSRDHMVGLQWTPTLNWGVFAEYHYIDGTANVSSADNQGRERERYWQTLLLMLAYQF